jgi:hypothetical protein
VAQLAGVNKKRRGTSSRRLICPVVVMAGNHAPPEPLPGQNWFV